VLLLLNLLSTKDHYPLVVQFNFALYLHWPHTSEANACKKAKVKLDNKRITLLSSMKQNTSKTDALQSPFCSLRSTFLAVGDHRLFPRIFHECHCNTHGQYAERGNEHQQQERSSANGRLETQGVTTLCCATQNRSEA
jgi:hypothetical protein